MEDQIIKQGVKNLKEYGYNDVDKDNIFTDQIYSQFFLSMLKDNLGKGADKPINNLIARIATPTNTDGE